MRSLLTIAVLIQKTVSHCGLGNVCLEIYNKCPFPIWPGLTGSAIVENGGFFLNSGEHRAIGVPNTWTNGRIWARTGCSDNFTCETGSCGNTLGCEGRAGEPPATTAEFDIIASEDDDRYRVSIVDGYNLPVLIDVEYGTYRIRGGDKDCQRAGGCFKNLNDKHTCPPELRVVRNGHIVACKSACLAFDTDDYCCRGAFSSVRNCDPKNWMKNYDLIFKNACPKTFSYKYDENTFTCRGKDWPSPTYRVQFC